MEMRMRRSVIALSLATLVVAAAGCDFFHDSGSSTSPTAIVEKFSGALKQQGSVVFSFTTTQAGIVSVMLAAISPDTSATVGMGIGTVSTTTCSLTTTASAVAAGSTAQLSVSATAGTYCVQVYDANNVPQTETVSVTVAHP
jgi:hypothetical protein